MSDTKTYVIRETGVDVEKSGSLYLSPNGIGVSHTVLESFGLHIDPLINEVDEVDEGKRLWDELPIGAEFRPYFLEHSEPSFIKISNEFVAKNGEVIAIHYGVTESYGKIVSVYVTTSGDRFYQFVYDAFRDE